MDNNHIKAIRQILGGDKPFSAGSVSLSCQNMATLVGWANQLQWRRLEMPPETAKAARTPAPALKRLLVLMVAYQREHGELPDFDKMESELIAELNEAKDI